MGQGCEWTNWINQIEGNMDFTLEEGQAIRGVKTEWNDDKGQFIEEGFNSYLLELLSTVENHRFDQCVLDWTN